jgi:hypothetical protein
MIPRGQIARVALVAAALALFLAPVRVPAQEKTDDVYVRVNGTVDLAAGDNVDTLVAVNSGARVADTVRDTLVIVNQTATVSGDVGRDAIVANGTLDLEPTAHIGGDVVLINGELSQADGAVIAGRVVERRGASIGAELNRVTAAVSLIVWLGMTLLVVVVRRQCNDDTPRLDAHDGHAQFARPAGAGALLRAAAGVGGRDRGARVGHPA